jgi:hypothetical protein
MFKCELGNRSEGVVLSAYLNAGFTVSIMPARITAFRYSLTMSESSNYPVFKGPATL